MPDTQSPPPQESGNTAEGSAQPAQGTAPIESVLDDIGPASYKKDAPKQENFERNPSELSYKIESKLSLEAELKKPYQGGAPIESVLNDIGPASYKKPAPAGNPLLQFKSSSMRGWAFRILIFFSVAGILGLLYFGINKNTVPQQPPVPVAGDDEGIMYGNIKYYRVFGDDLSLNTGDKVCAQYGQKCKGYTAFTIDVCKAFHPDATVSADFNGSKAGFYCNGPPQGGVCAQEYDTCHVCSQCNVNAECSTVIGDFYKEMYVECGPKF